MEGRGLRVARDLPRESRVSRLPRDDDDDDFFLAVQVSPITPRMPKREYVPSVSSATGERSSPPHQDPPNADPVQWDPVLSEVWVQFPGHTGPVLGWYRVGAASLPNAYFGSDGEMRAVSQTTLADYLYAAPGSQLPEDDPLAVALHPLLRPSAREALSSQHIVSNPRTSTMHPVASAGEWQTLLNHGGQHALTYTLTCAQCALARSIQRMDSRIVENLPNTYRFKCQDVKAVCYIIDSQPVIRAFALNPPNKASQTKLPRASSSTSLPTASMLRGSALTPLSGSGDEDREGRGWRKRIKDWSSVPKYAGTTSLVLLKGWQAALVEAFREARVPEGRDQVLAAAHFYSGAAAQWWANIIGQPLGASLTSFAQLCDALDEHFIPQDAALKAIGSWKGLKQNGTVDEYMQRADEIATSHPMGEVGEFWLIWVGLRPELRAEVRYALREERRETCSRQDLRKILKGLEVKYPAPVPRPFFPRPAVRQVQTAPVQQAQAVCWVCDKTGHRAPECPRRKTSGCSRCGSKAHTLFTCPQRRPVRPPGPRELPGGNNRRGKGTTK